MLYPSGNLARYLPLVDVAHYLLLPHAAIVGVPGAQQNTVIDHMMYCTSLTLLQICIAFVGREVDSNQRLSSQHSIILWLNNSDTISYVNSCAHVAVFTTNRTHQNILLPLQSNHPHLLHYVYVSTHRSTTDIYTWTIIFSLLAMTSSLPTSREFNFFRYVL